jgi:hypothetical protein
MRPETLSTGPPCFTTTLPACPSSPLLRLQPAARLPSGQDFGSQPRPTKVLPSWTSSCPPIEPSLPAWSQLQHCRPRCSFWELIQRNCLDAQQKIHETMVALTVGSMGEAKKPSQARDLHHPWILSLAILPATTTPPSCEFALRGCKLDARRPVSHLSLHAVLISCAALALQEAEQMATTAMAWSGGL